MVLDSIIAEYKRYRGLAERALAQVADEDLNRAVGDDDNSIAVVMNHVSGNLASRFTYFLTEDGEKPWRDRDTEFAEGPFSREDVLDRWERGWGILFDTLASLSDADFPKEVKIRGIGLTVHDALHRSLAHVAYHVGQIVTVARVHVGKDWKSLSIPRGGTVAYNQNPTLEKPGR